MRTMVREQLGRISGLFVVVALIAGCGGDMEPPGSTAPILPPTGTVTSEAFIRLFVGNCVTHFPDPDASGRAFLADGFTEVGDGHVANGWWSLQRRSEDLKASINPTAERTPASRVPPFDWSNSCTLTGNLADPDRLAAELLGVEGGDSRPVRWSSSDGFLDATFERDGTTLHLRARLPNLYVEPVHLSPRDVCGDLPTCRKWGHAHLTIHMGDYPRE